MSQPLNSVPDLTSFLRKIYFGHTICSVRSTCAEISVKRKKSLSTEKTALVEYSTRDPAEIAKFNHRASSWYKPQQRFNLILEMNSLRVPFILNAVLSNKITSFTEKTKTLKSLDGLRILDVGCGGGFLSEALARLGASVTGIDPGLVNIRVAVEHAAADSSLDGKLKYICSTVEELVGNTECFDAVICSEVIEHVENQEFFVRCCTDLVKENGSLFFTTPNQSVMSYLINILAYEYVFGIIPKGTHDRKKFIRSSELEKLLKSHGCKVQIIHGMLYNPIKGWLWTESTNVWYAMHALKMT